MKLSEFKAALSQMNELNFVQANGQAIPSHFHITEAAFNTKHFIDCGGTERTEKNISFQLWTANDLEHRLSPAKLLQIVDIYERKINAEDLEVEVEYQAETIGKYGVSVENGQFVFVPKFTDCLASDSCGIPAEKLKKPMAELQTSAACCTPGGGCC
ncbi:MAG: DUF6428 family protein [Chitinophagaceae bacterium]|jgi:hypothetical protein